MIDVELARDTLKLAAESYDTGEGQPPITGYREPAGEITMPAFVVLDPQVQYHQAWDTAGDMIRLRARLIAPLTVDTASSRALDRLLHSQRLPAHLEAYTTHVWEELTVLGTVGQWSDYRQDGISIGVSADLDIRLVFPDSYPEEEPDP